MRSKKEIKQLISEGQLLEATAAAVTYADAAADIPTLNGLIALQGDLNRQREVWLSGQLSFEEYHRTSARITAALLARIESLPNEASPKATKQRMLERSYKWLVFSLLISSKVVVVLWVFFVWRVEGFQNEEALTAFNAILPGLIVYGAIMFKNLFRSELAADVPLRYVPSRFRVMAWLIFIVYAALQVLLVRLKATGDISFTLMNMAMVGIEAGMGQVIGEVVEGVFKRDEV